jgi:tetratricopeptide (TPR) repeat protein
MHLRAAVALLLLGSLTSSARADTRRDQQARDAYRAGATAYEAGDYQTAYQRFKDSFQLSHEPALLYNIASALQGLKRPHDAAEALRSFLRVQPNDPDRPKIEQRVATLEEEQRMIDADRAKEESARPRATEPPPPPRPSPLVTKPTEPSPPPPIVAVPQPEPSQQTKDRRRRTAIIVGVTIGAAVLVAGAVTLGVLLSQPTTDPYSMGSIGPLPGTR